MQKRNKRREVKEHFIELVFYQQTSQRNSFGTRSILGILEGDTGNVEEASCGFRSRQQVDMALYDHAPVYLVSKAYSRFLHCLHQLYGHVTATFMLIEYSWRRTLIFDFI